MITMVKFTLLFTPYLAFLSTSIHFLLFESYEGEKCIDSYFISCRMQVSYSMSLVAPELEGFILINKLNLKK